MIPFLTHNKAYCGSIIGRALDERPGHTINRNLLVGGGVPGQRDHQGGGPIHCLRKSRRLVAGHASELQADLASWAISRSAGADTVGAGSSARMTQSGYRRPADRFALMPSAQPGHRIGTKPKGNTDTGGDAYRHVLSIDSIWQHQVGPPGFIQERRALVTSTLIVKAAAPSTLMREGCMAVEHARLSRPVAGPGAIRGRDRAAGLLLYGNRTRIRSLNCLPRVSFRVSCWHLRQQRTLLTIINDILDFSKIESGKLELEDRPFDLRALHRGSPRPAGSQSRREGPGPRLPDGRRQCRCRFAATLPGCGRSSSTCSATASSSPQQAKWWPRSR